MNTESDVVEFGVEVKLLKNFLVIKETLERIGIANRETKVITPSCYLLHKQGRYYLMHFKELLAMDGYKREIIEKDIERRNSIATLLKNWNMIDILIDGIYQGEDELKQQIFVLPYSEKVNYKINHKYRIKNKR